MPSIDTLATGLSGAIGCHYHGPSNRLYFVEYGGKLSCYDFVRQPAALLLGNAARTLKGTWLMDLDTGAMVAGVAPADGLLAAKSRYRQADAACRLAALGAGRYNLAFNAPQWAVTPGQSAVLYDGEVCLGGGVIAASTPAQ